MQRLPGVVFLIYEFTITRVVASASEAALRKSSKTLSALHVMTLVDMALT